MPKFFTDIPIEKEMTLTGQTAAHITKSLRMRVGDEVVLCDGKGFDHACIIKRISKDALDLELAFKTPSESEPQVRIELYQGLPKGDKLADVVRRCTEIGVSAFHPVLMARSVARPDQKSAAKKLQRLKTIAAEAAGQSRRGIIPTVCEIGDYTEALQESSCEGMIVFYENGGEKLSTVLGDFKKAGVKSLALVIGPEGGFDEKEIARAKQLGARVCTLGKRILRTETAPVVAAAAVLYEYEG